VSGSERDQEMRRMAREVLSELVPGILRDVMHEPGRDANGNGVGHADGNGAGHTNGNGAGHSNGNGNGAHRARTPIVDRPPGPVPQVPAPPTPAVLRPSTWKRPAAPGEVIGQPGPGGAAPAPARAEAPPAAAAPPRAAARPTAAATPSSSTPPARTDHLPAPNATAQNTTAEARNAVANPGADARVEAVTIDSDDDLMQFVRQLLSRVANPRDRLAIHTGKLRFSLRSRPGSPAAAPAAAAGPVTRIAKGAVTERVIREVADAGTRLVLAPGTVLTPLARERAHALGVEIERERK
jgi:hypothetical protein